IEIRIRRGKNLHHIRILVRNLRQEADTRLVGHPLVGHNDPDIFGMFTEYLESLDTVGRLEDPEGFAVESAEVLTRLLLVVDEENGILLVVVAEVAHDWGSLVSFESSSADSASKG